MMPNPLRDDDIRRRFIGMLTGLRTIESVSSGWLRKRRVYGYTICEAVSARNASVEQWPPILRISLEVCVREQYAI